MVGLEIRFDLGRYHANPWSSHVNEAATEWPPSPWRLIRALYAVARTNTCLIDSQSAIDRALTALVQAPPPVFELPPTTRGHTRHYMPKHTYSPTRPGDTDKIIDGFVVVDPDEPLRVWWGADLDTEAHLGLERAGAALGYLGRSESVCSATILDRGPAAGATLTAPLASAPADRPRDGDLIDLMCPDTNATLDDLAVSVTELRKAHRLIPTKTRKVTYLVPRSEVAGPRTRTRRPKQLRPTLAVLRLGGSRRPPLTEAVAIGQGLRRALQSQYGRREAGSASSTFSGRAGDQPRFDQHRHAHFLTLPDRNGRRADRLLVWAPEGFGAGEVAAVAEVAYITVSEIPVRLQCALGALGTVRELEIPDLLGPSRVWESLTPFGLVRHPKRRGGRVVDGPEDQVARELEHRGFPDPEEIGLEKGSWHRFRSSQAGQSGLDRANLYGVWLRFAAEQMGPIAIGALSHYGLGLMVPGDRRTA